MPGSFEDTYVGNLIGLWDFLVDAEGQDTGNDDGVAQNGQAVDGASFSGGWLRTDGLGDRFEVNGDDQHFNLSSGTLITQFQQFSQVGCDADTIVSRGEAADYCVEGFFEIRVTTAGAVQAVHADGGKVSVLSTSDCFFNPCDILKVTYSWSASGPALIVENISQGTTAQDANDVSGLTFDITDGDNDNFSIAAREANDGVYDQYFDGRIDYVAVLDQAALSQRDGIVEGTDKNDLIDVTYTGDPDGDMIDSEDAVLPGQGPNDDIVLAGAGDDTVLAGLGDDEIHGGKGNDTLDGGVGDDVIFGGAGSDSVTGGNGNDRIDTRNLATPPLPDLGFPSYMGLPAIPADPDPFNDRDVVDGGDGDDVILTGDDEDIVTGGSGNDYIDGGLDRDFLDGGAGDDFIIGGEGSDNILAGDGNDTVYGGLHPSLPDELNIRNDGSLGDPDPEINNGRDVIDGGAGDDVIFGQDDDDTLLGGSGNDRIDGGIDDDVIFGEEGNDYLLGGQGIDTIIGGIGNDTIDGGIGADNMSGGADRDTFVNITQGDAVDGNETFTSDATDDFDTLDLRGSAAAANPGGSLQVDYDPANAENGTVTYRDSGGTITGSVEFSNIENVIVCFTPQTLIASPKGELRVQDLKVGDRVITRDNGIQEIRWIGRRNILGTELKRKVHLRPVLIRQGALGNGLPERDLMVSPNHRVLVNNDKTALYFEDREVLVAAKHLTGLPGVETMWLPETTYTHFMFDRHEVVLSDGAWSESFQPSDRTVNGMGNAQRTEIFELFPELQSEVGMTDYKSARRSLKKYEAQLLVQ